MSRGVSRDGVTSHKGRPSKDDPDLALAMDLAYHLNRRKQKCASPFYHSSNMSTKSVKTRLSDRKDGTSSPLKTRARQIKSHETTPFLLVDTIPDEKRHTLTEGSDRNDGLDMPRGQSFNQSAPMSPMAPRQQSRFSMYSSPSIPTRHTLTRGSGSRRALASSMSQKTLPGHTKSRSSNHHVKMPFKHSVHKPVVPTPPDRASSPSHDLKERTALATYHVNKVLCLEKQTSQQKNKGKLLKAKLKPLYPVQVRGPSIENCRGILADTHEYSASASKTLQRRKQILSSMNAGELKDLLDRPRTVESIHRTSVASSVDENKDHMVENKPESDWAPESLSSTSTTPSVRSTPSHAEQDLNDIVEPPDFATGSPIISRESSRDTLGDSTRDTSTVFLTAGKNVEDAEEEVSLVETIQPEVEDASREIIEMAEMLKKRISLIGIETGDLLEAENRGNDLKTEESSETESRSGVGPVNKDILEPANKDILEPVNKDILEPVNKDILEPVNKDILELQEDQQSVTSSVEARVRPFSATTQQSPTVGTVKLDTRPLSTGDVSRRKGSRSKSVRFADETESPRKSQAWQEENMNEDKSSENANAETNVNNNNLSSGQSKSRCKPNDKEFSADSNDPDDDDKENHAPKKSPYFSSSQTFSQALAISSNPQLSSSESGGNAPKDCTEPVTRTSFMEEFLAHAAPIDDSICSVSSEDYLHEDSMTGGKSSEAQKDKVKPFPLMSLSERIAGACKKSEKLSDSEDNNNEIPESHDDETTQDVIEEIVESKTEGPKNDNTEIEESVPLVTDPAVNLTFSSHNLLNQLEQSDGGVETLKDKPPVHKTRRKKSKSKGNGKRAESPLRNGRPNSPNAEHPGSPKRNSRKDGNHTIHNGAKSKNSSKVSSGLYGIEGRHHFPSDLIDEGHKGTSDRAKTCGMNQAKPRKLGCRPGSSSVRPSSGHSASSHSSRTSTVKSHERNDLPTLNFDDKDDLEDVDILTYDDLDWQINRIQSELKKNIDQQERLLNETETLRQSLKSREGFYSDRDPESEDGAGKAGKDEKDTSLRLQSDSYYQSLLMSYRKKCMEVSENCLMISEHITSPRWQETGTTEDQGQTVKDKMSKDVDDVDLILKGVPAAQPQPEDKELESEAAMEAIGEDVQSSEKQENFLRLLCTTVEEVEQPVEEKSCLEIGSESLPGKRDLKVVATRKELSKEKVKPRVKASAPFPPLCFSINARPPQGYLYYFSYGEHMNTERMCLYLKKTVSRFWGLLMGFNLAFNKKGEDVEAGGFATIEFNPFCSVEGCVYQLNQEDISILDKHVGAPQHYCRVVLPIWMSNTTDPDALGVAQYCVPAVTYIAQDQWLHKESSPLSVEHSAPECVKSADLLTPAYRSHLSKMAAMSTPVLQPATA